MITIRESRPEDAAALLDHIRLIGGETDNLTFGPEGLPFTVEQEEAYIRSVSEDPKAVMLSVWEDGVLLGEGSLSPLPRRMSHRAELGLSVRKSAWHRGIGSMIMEKLIASAREKGLELIHLEVRSDNTRAVRLYEKYGFRRIGTFPAFFKIGNDYFDFEEMVLDLRRILS